MEVNDQIHKITALFLQKENPVLVEREAGWAPETVWMFWVKVISTTSSGMRTQYRSDSSSVSIPTALLKNGTAGKFEGGGGVECVKQISERLEISESTTMNAG
jgi:hypothetical protein